MRKLFSVSNWLKTPADRDIISLWTVGADGASADASAPMQTYALELPPVRNPASWEFLALGDTGDSDASGPAISPQDAVGQNLAMDAALPSKNGRGEMVLHMGDVIYMTGEKRLYDRNFRRPYSDFLAPQSTVENLTFHIPFLPVPGNHDYYDLGGWAMWLSRVPFIGSGLKALTHYLFAFSVPEGGSDSGRAYMEAFVDLKADTRQLPLPYQPGVRTRVPNRYYRFTRGGADFFALDSNTLDAPPPSAGVAQIREDAAQRVAALEKQAEALDADLRRDQRALETWRTEHRESVARDAELRASLVERTAAVAASLAELNAALRTATDLPATASACHAKALMSAMTTEKRWLEGSADMAETEADNTAAPEETPEGNIPSMVAALTALEEASDEACETLRAVEMCLAGLPEGATRTTILGARDKVSREIDRWAETAAPAPTELSERLRKLSEDALDIQRELALERRRTKYRPEDHDAAQIRWLDQSLAESVTNRPGHWRIVYLHHPLYTTIGNHCERPDVIDLRENLLSVLRGRVDLIISGHSHGFEWFRSDALPDTGLFVTGGGGQVSLRPSILASARRFTRHQDSYEAMRRAGVREWAMAGLGPTAEDGEDGMVYHYLRIEVTPDTLRVRPVGVRRLASGGFRREEPMPAFHAAEMPSGGRPRLHARRMAAVALRRGHEPVAEWEEG